MHRTSILIALLLLMMSGFAGTAKATGDSTSSAPARNPELAGALSLFLPGMGHVYAGETTKGWVLMGLFVGSIGAVTAADIGTTHDSIRAGGWLSVTALATVYLYALIDAPFAAIRYNERISLSQIGGRPCIRIQIPL